MTTAATAALEADTLALQQQLDALEIHDTNYLCTAEASAEIQEEEEEKDEEEEESYENPRFRRRKFSQEFENVYRVSYTGVCARIDWVS